MADLNEHDSPKLTRTGDQEEDQERNRNEKRDRDDLPLEGDKVDL